jgi:hypothetical protein
MSINLLYMVEYIPRIYDIIKTIQLFLNGFDIRSLFNRVEKNERAALSTTFKFIRVGVGVQKTPVIRVSGRQLRNFTSHLCVRPMFLCAHFSPASIQGLSRCGQNWMPNKLFHKHTTDKKVSRSLFISSHQE